MTPAGAPLSPGQCRYCGAKNMFPLRTQVGFICSACLAPYPYRALRRSAPKKLTTSPARWTRIGRQAARVADRDGWTCHLCGQPVDPLADGDGHATVDHVIPRSVGGPNALTNLRLAHYGCNIRRGNRPLEEA